MEKALTGVRVLDLTQFGLARRVRSCWPGWEQKSSRSKNPPGVIRGGAASALSQHHRVPLVLFVARRQQTQRDTQPRARRRG